jgi:hypothetical protein
VLVDESTTLGKQSTLIAYIKTFLDEKEEIIFLDLIALENQKAETITTQVLNCFYSYGLTQSYLKRNLICFACDGASVMVVRNSGVGKVLQNKLQQRILFGTVSVIDWSWLFTIVLLI